MRVPSDRLGCDTTPPPADSGALVFPGRLGGAGGQPKVGSGGRSASVGDVPIHT